MASYLDHGDDRRVRPARLPRGRHPLLGRDRPGPLHADRAAHGRRLRALAVGGLQPTSGCRARSACRPAGAQLSFWVTRDTEPDWDFMFVEAHPVGSDDWTTLPDLNGHTSDRHRLLLPVRAGRRSIRSSPTTRPTTATAPARPTGHDRRVAGGQRRQRRLRAVDGRPLRLRRPGRRGLDQLRQRRRRRSAAACSSTTSWSPAAPGSTSFEDDGDTLDGWTVPGAPEGSPGNENDWIAGTVADAPPTARRGRRGSLARQPEIIAFLSGIFGPLPVLGRRRDRRRRRRARLRARDPDAADLRAGLLRQPGTRRLRRRPRARAPVERRQPRARRAGSTSGSTRASRPTPSGCGASARGSGPRRRSSTTSPTSSRPTTRSGR